MPMLVLCVAAGMVFVAWAAALGTVPSYSYPSTRRGNQPRETGASAGLPRPPPGDSSEVPTTQEPGAKSGEEAVSAASGGNARPSSLLAAASVEIDAASDSVEIEREEQGMAASASVEIDAVEEDEKRTSAMDSEEESFLAEVGILLRQIEGDLDAARVLLPECHRFRQVVGYVSEAVGPGMRTRPRQVSMIRGVNGGGVFFKGGRGCIHGYSFHGGVRAGREVSRVLTKRRRFCVNLLPTLKVFGMRKVFLAKSKP